MCKYCSVTDLFCVLFCFVLFRAVVISYAFFSFPPVLFCFCSGVVISYAFLLLSVFTTHVFVIPRVHQTLNKLLYVTCLCLYLRFVK